MSFAKSSLYDFRLIAPQTLLVTTADVIE